MKRFKFMPSPAGVMPTITFESGWAVCQSCNRDYDMSLETKEVAESGDYICSDCWEEEE
jgi:DNA-directed RNA polymerase subunit RPC12/RpoP